MNIQEFFKKYNKKGIDRDKAYGYQCMDLYNQYQDECLNIKVVGAPYAKDVWEKYNKDAFSKIKNTPQFVPKLGDVAVWSDSNVARMGHVSICTGKGDTKKFESFDQNWSNKYCEYVMHSYVGVMGFLRPIDQKNIIGVTVSKYKVTAKIGLNLRKGVGTSTEKLIAIPYNTEIQVIETKQGENWLWGKTNYKGKVGWCALTGYTKRI